MWSAVLLVLLAWPWSTSAQPATWEREGLTGHKVRAIFWSAHPAALIGLTLGSREEAPLWFFDDRGWWQPAVDLPGPVLTGAALPAGGVLLGTGRDISARPGLYWVGGDPLTARQLYGVQAIGAVAVAPAAHGADILAAAAPYGDREAGSELLRHDAETGTWSTVLHGTLVCGDSPSFFKQVVVSRHQPVLALAVEECVEPVARQTQLWQSADRGRSWQVLPRPAGTFPLIRTVQIDAGAPATWYLAGLDQPDTVARGIERSDDGGASWSRVGDSVPGLAGVRVIALDPRDRRRVVVGTEKGAVYLSSDRGESWQALSGLDGLRIWALEIHPTTGLLYAATSDGIWKLPLPEPAIT